MTYDDEEYTSGHFTIQGHNPGMKIEAKNYSTVIYPKNSICQFYRIHLILNATSAWDSVIFGTSRTRFPF